MTIVLLFFFSDIVDNEYPKNCSLEQFWKIFSFREAVLANPNDVIEGTIKILEDVYWDLVKIFAMHFCGGHVYG